MPELKRGHEEDLSMDEDFRRCKRHTSKKKKYRHVSKLLSLAAEGKHKKLARLLRKHSELDVNSYNSDGLTALHQAARFGHEKAVCMLLERGADTKAEDFEGRTAAHLAAAEHKIGVLAVLLEDNSQLDASGLADQSELKEAIRFAMANRLGQSPAATSPTRVEQSSFLSESEDDWEEKLRMNADYDNPFHDGILGSSSSTWESWDYDSFVEPGFDPADEDRYARQMWEDMQRKTASHRQAGAATAEAWAKADSAQKRREKAAEDAAEHSRKILEEEQAKDRAWRQAVLQGDQGAKRAAYEAKWQTLVTMAGPIIYGDVPWLGASDDGAQALILHGVSSAAERKKRLRQELMRWHPDKFVAKFGSSLISGDQDRITEGVKRVSQLLNSLNKE